MVRFSFNGNGKRAPKIDPRITKVNYVGCVGEGGFGDHDRNCNREPDYDIDHNR